MVQIALDFSLKSTIEKLCAYAGSPTYGPQSDFSLVISEKKTKVDPFIYESCHNIKAVRQQPLFGGFLVQEMS